jgi:hypothetical protein
MCLEYDGIQVKDMPSFNLSSLIKPGCLHLCCGYVYFLYIDLGWITRIINDDVLPILGCCLVINKNIESIGTWRTTQENSTTTVLHGSGLG